MICELQNKKNKRRCLIQIGLALAKKVTNLPFTKTIMSKAYSILGTAQISEVSVSQQLRA